MIKVKSTPKRLLDVSTIGIGLITQHIKGAGLDKDSLSLITHSIVCGRTQAKYRATYQVL